MQNKKGYEKLQEKMQVTSKGVPLRTTEFLSGNRKSQESLGQYDSSLGLTQMSAQMALASKTIHYDWRIMREKLLMMKVDYKKLWS